MSPENQKKKFKIILNCIKEAPHSLALIIANFITSFLSVAGIPLLIFAYQYSQTENKDDLPYNENLKYIFELFNIDLNFYSLLFLSLILIILGQTCLGAIELTNRYINIKVIKKNSINLINYFRDAKWIKILEDKSGKFQHAMNIESVSSAQVVLDSLRLASATIQVIFYLATSFYFSFKTTGLLLFFFSIMGLVTIIISCAVANFMNDYQQKKYNLSTTISVKEENNPLFSTGTNIAFNWGGASDEIETIKVIIGSRSHNEKVVRKLNFFINYLKEGSYRMEDMYGYTPFTVNLHTDKPQLYNKLLKVELTGDDTYKISFDFKELGADKLVTYDSNIVSEFVSEKTSFSEEFKIDESINTPFLNFSLKKKGKFKVGETYFIRFASFDGTVASYRGVSVRTITAAASLLDLSMSGPN